MKILMICTEKLPVPAVRGGAIQTYIDGVSSVLSKHHDITILGTTDPSLPLDEKVNNIRYVRTQGGLLEDYRDGVKQFLQSEPGSYDVIHIFNRPRLVLAVREHAPKARLVLSMHNDMFKRQKIEPEEAEAAIEQLDKIVTVSDYIGKTISDLFPQAAPKLKTIYSGVDIDRFVPPHSSQAQNMREEIRKVHNLQGKKVILFAGRLSANKGADILVKAMPELAKKHPDIALVLVGSKWFSVNEVSDYVAYVRALAARLPIPVINTGFVAPSEIQKWFAAADVFVCPSQWQEPLARVHYEAMASGLPIITTARGGNPEVITPNVNGFVVEQPEDPQAFVDLLAPLLSDPKLSKKLGQQGRKMAEENFTWSRVISDIHDVWNEVEYKLKNNIAVTATEEENEELSPEAQANQETFDLSEMEADSTIELELELATDSKDLPLEDQVMETPEDDLVAEYAPKVDETIEEKPAELVVEDLNSEGDSQTETIQKPPMTKEEKLKSILMFEINNKESIIESLLSVINQKIVNENEHEVNSLIKKVVTDFEELIKGQLQTKKPEPQKEFIQAINDITTAKLFTQLKSKRQRRKKSSSFKVMTK
ncbi:glycosyltransferase family 4 protein [Halalkalibacter lacteus]|uniref:glycosyltransferase family 4 protein n=1 Tax=Halalkalibacter lacteus TaxID=3090663 RepID=UPI003D674F8C